MISKFYKKFRSLISLGRKMATNKKCPPSDAAGKAVAKPNLRNFHLKQSLRNLYVALALSGITSTAFYFLHNVPHKKAYQDFYATYNSCAAFERMRKAGYLSSCPPDPPGKKRNCLLSFVK